jgi:hypothetical protein
MQIHCHFTATIKKKNNQSPTAAKQAPAKRAPTPAKKAPAKAPVKALTKSPAKAPARAPVKALTKAPVKSGKASPKHVQVTEASDLPIGAKVGCPEGYQLVDKECHFTFNNDSMMQYDFDPNSPPEKIETHEDPHAHHHTTYYAQNNTNSSQPALIQIAEPFNANIEPEKIETLIPEAYRTQPHAITRNPERRTTFYVQNATNASSSSFVQFDANIEPEKIHTLIPEAYRTTANDRSYVFNLGTQRSTFYNQVDSEVHYDEKNGLWRLNNNLVQTGKTEDDAVGKDNRDPWVYEFTHSAVKDILYDPVRASSPNGTIAMSLA